MAPTMKPSTNGSHNISQSNVQESNPLPTNTNLGSSIAFIWENQLSPSSYRLNYINQLQTVRARPKADYRGLQHSRRVRKRNTKGFMSQLLRKRPTETVWLTKVAEKATKAAP